MAEKGGILGYDKVVWNSKKNIYSNLHSNYIFGDGILHSS